MIATARDSEGPLAQQRRAEAVQELGLVLAGEAAVDSQPVMASMSGSFMIGGHVLAMHG